MKYSLVSKRAIPDRSAFTLVELLVVIGIIALLISILLPALGKARDQANIVKCLSNVRQLGMAAMLFAQDHKGHIPTCSDDTWVETYDPYRQYFVYRSDPTRSSGYVVDWASSLLPYLGNRSSDQVSFQNAPQNQTKVFVCPTDPMQGKGLDSGYRLINNVAVTASNTTVYSPISYGINADIACIVDPTGQNGVFNPGTSNTYNFWDGRKGVTNGLPLECKLGRIYMPSQVLLFADCGVRPESGSNPLDWSDGLYYTTNWIETNSQLTTDQFYTLQGVYLSSWLGDRIPCKLHGDRHGNKINVAFADGHAATVAVGSFNTVRVSPYR